MKDIAFGHIALNSAVNICMHSFPLPLIAYEFSHFCTQISQHYHKTQIWV